MDDSLGNLEPTLDLYPDRPAPVDGLWMWLAVLGGMLHVTAPGAIDGRIPRPNKVRLGVGVGLGLGVSTRHFDRSAGHRPVVDALEPGMRE